MSIWPPLLCCVAIGLAQGGLLSVAVVSALGITPSWPLVAWWWGSVGIAAGLIAAGAWIMRREGR